MKSVILDEILNSKTSDKLDVATEEALALLGDVAKYEDELKEKLPPELYRLVMKYSDAMSIHNCEQVDVHFVEGFKCGFRLAIECLKD